MLGGGDPCESETIRLHSLCIRGGGGVEEFCGVFTSLKGKGGWYWEFLKAGRGIAIFFGCY